MLRLLESLPAWIASAVACPPGGRLAEVLDEHGIDRFDLSGSEVSFRLRPATTVPGLAALVRSVVELRMVARRWHADVIHANSIRAGLFAAGSARIGAPPLVVQVHDDLPQNSLGRAVRVLLARGADEVIAVSDWTARSFNAGLSRPVARRVYISIDHARFRPGRDDHADTRRSLGVPEGVPLLGEVAQITPWKGQMVAIEALAGVRARHPDAQLVLVGHVAFAKKGVRFDNARYFEDLKARVRQLGLENAVHFVGQRSDVPAVMSALDLLLLPSWEEPFGTAALEAMAVGTVPLVGTRGGVTEYVEDGVCGRVLDPTDPMLWAKAAADLLDDPSAGERMGRRAVEVASRFTDEAYAQGSIEAYRAATRRKARFRRRPVRGQ